MCLEVLEVCSTGWDKETILNFTTRVTEGHSYDRKSKIKRILHSAKSVPDDMTRSVRDFVKDSIAMANSARRRGHYCYIVFGVNNKWDYIGICGQSTRHEEEKRAELEKMCRTAQGLEKLQMEWIARDFCDIATRYIHPKPDLDYQFGWITKDKSPYLIGYLVFSPTDSSEPYTITSTSNKNTSRAVRDLGLEPGQCWTRRADSNEQVDIVRDPHLVALWRDIPFVPYSNWLTYSELAEKHLANIENTKPILDGFEELALQLIEVSDHNNRPQGNVEKLLEQFVYSDEPVFNTLQVFGYGGSGKTTTLVKLARQMLQELRNNLKINNPAKWDQPQVPIPLFVDMKDFNPQSDSTHVQQELIQYVLAPLRGIWRETRSQIESILNDQSVSFVIIMDSVDEIDERHFDTARRAIIAFVKAHSFVKFIIASRPRTIEYTSLANNQAYLQSLRLEQIVNRIESSHLPGSDKSSLIESISSDQALRELISIPVMLDACIAGVQQTARFSLGNVVKFTIEGLLKREASSLVKFERMRHFQDELERLAYLIWKDSTIPRRSMQSFNYITRFLQLGLLRESKEPGRIEFASPYLVDFFAARQLDEDPIFWDEHAEFLYKDPGQHVTIIRLLANWSQGDLSTSKYSTLIAGINEPLTSLSIYFERNEAIVSDTSDYYLLWAELADQESELGDIIDSLLKRGLTDSFDGIVNATVDIYIDYEDKLIDHIDSRFVSTLFIEEEDVGRRAILWRLFIKVTELSFSEIVRELVRDLTLNEEFIIEMLDSEELDWQSGYPLDYPLFGMNNPDSIRMEVLKRMHAVPDEYKEELENDAKLKTTNSEIRKEVERLLNKEIELYEVPQTQLSDTSVGMDILAVSTVLADLSQEGDDDDYETDHDN